MSGAWRAGAAACAALLALAARPGAALAELTWDLSLGARVMYSDNLHLDPEPQSAGEREPVRETVYAAIPALQLEWLEGRDRLFLDALGEYWTFSGDEERDPEWLPDLNGALAWRRWEPFFVEAEAVRERVPVSQDREGDSLLDQADRTRLRGRTGLAWERSPTMTGELVYRGSLESFSDSGDGEGDRVVRNYGEALVQNRWSPRWSSEVRGRYGQVGQELAEDYTEMLLGGLVEYRLSERTVARGRLDWLREDYDASDAVGEAAETRTYLLKSLEVRGELERGGFWTLRYDDRLESQPNGDTLELGRASLDGRFRTRSGSEIVTGIWHETRDFRISGREDTDWGPTLFARWLIVPWSALDLGGSWARSTIRVPGEAEGEDRTTRAGAALLFLVGRHLVAEAGYVYRQNDSTDPARGYVANLLFAGVTYHFPIVQPGRLPASTIDRLTTSDLVLPAGR